MLTGKTASIRSEPCECVRLRSVALNLFFFFVFFFFFSFCLLVFRSCLAVEKIDCQTEVCRTLFLHYLHLILFFICIS
uniref:Uncharacterized protein n=1 Tax=Rhizophora mucronata TaxID=61149 RepID=A0A2P2LWB9_RHIMU